MRASRLLRGAVRTASGEPLGVVHDVQLHRTGNVVEVRGIVVGADTWRLRAAYSTGIAQRRTTGPAPLRALLRPGQDQVMLVDAADVVAWSDSAGVVVADRVAGAMS